MNIHTTGFFWYKKVEADINEFVAWCVTNGYDVDSTGRNAFTSHKVAISLGLITD